MNFDSGKLVGNIHEFEGELSNSEEKTIKLDVGSGNTYIILEHS